MGTKNPEPFQARDFSSDQLLSLVDGDLLAVLAQTLETDNAVGLGKQSVIGAHTDIGAGVDVGAALANKNVAGENELTISALGAKTLGLGITAVLGGTNALLVGEELQTNVQHFAVPSFLKDRRSGGL